MRSYRTLRPRLLGDLVAEAVRSAASGDNILDVRQQAELIAAETGFAVRTVANELVVAGIKAGANVEFPRLSELDPFTTFLEGRRRSRAMWRTCEPGEARRV